MKHILILLGVLFLSSLISCKGTTEEKSDIQLSKSFSEGNSIDEFWSWFEDNAKSLRNFQKDPDNHLNKIFFQVSKISSGLAIELEPPKDGVITMTVSANGNLELFPIVEQIVRKAPSIKGWKIVAFRQRVSKEEAKEIILKGLDHEINPNKMKFFPVVDNNQLDIIVYLDGITDENRESVAYGCLLLIDNILGEYDCVTKVRSYDFQQLPKEQSDLNNLLPLNDLATFVDNFHNSK